MRLTHGVTLFFPVFLLLSFCHTSRASFVCLGACYPTTLSVTQFVVGSVDVNATFSFLCPEQDTVTAESAVYDPTLGSIVSVDTDRVLYDNSTEVACYSQNFVFVAHTYDPPGDSKDPPGSFDIQLMFTSNLRPGYTWRPKWDILVYVSGAGTSEIDATPDSTIQMYQDPFSSLVNGIVLTDQGYQLTLTATNPDPSITPRLTVTNTTWTDISNPWSTPPPLGVTVGGAAVPDNSSFSVLSDASVSFSIGPGFLTSTQAVTYKVAVVDGVHYYAPSYVSFLPHALPPKPPTPPTPPAANATCIPQQCYLLTPPTELQTVMGGDALSTTPIKFSCPKNVDSVSFLHMQSPESLGVFGDAVKSVVDTSADCTVESFTFPLRVYNVWPRGAVNSTVNFVFQSSKSLHYHSFTRASGSSASSSSSSSSESLNRSHCGQQQRQSEQSQPQTLQKQQTQQTQQQLTASLILTVVTNESLPQPSGVRTTDGVIMSSDRQFSVAHPVAMVADSFQVISSANVSGSLAAILSVSQTTISNTSLPTPVVQTVDGVVVPSGCAIHAFGDSMPGTTAGNQYLVFTFPVEHRDWPPHLVYTYTIATADGSNYYPSRFVTLAPIVPDVPNSTPSKSASVAVIVGSSVGGVVFLALLIFCVIKKRRDGGGGGGFFTKLINDDSASVSFV